MVMRAIRTQRCQVCGAMTFSKSEMDEHIDENHGKDVERQAPTFLARAKEPMEFGSRVSQQTPWGADFR